MTEEKKHKPRMYKYQQRMEARLPIVAELYKHGYSYREIREETMARLGLSSYSSRTISKDIKRLLAEWREQRLTDTDELMQKELAVIDDIIKEAWIAWNKSKTDKTQRSAKQKGVPGEEGSGTDVITMQMEQATKELICYGDPRYLDVIDKQAKERRKLLGLYAPEKKEFTGDFSFEKLLMETGTEDEDDSIEDEEEGNRP